MGCGRMPLGREEKLKVSRRRAKRLRAQEQNRRRPTSGGIYGAPEARSTHDPTASHSGFTAPVGGRVRVVVGNIRPSRTSSIRPNGHRNGSQKTTDRPPASQIHLMAGQMESVSQSRRHVVLDASSFQGCDWIIGGNRRGQRSHRPSVQPLQPPS